MNRIILRIYLEVLKNKNYIYLYKTKEYVKGSWIDVYLVMLYYAKYYDERENIGWLF